MEEGIEQQREITEDHHLDLAILENISDVETALAFAFQNIVLESLRTYPRMIFKHQLYTTINNRTQVTERL